uniref:RING-type E3 ubiquitin transferase n=1 Tax=Anolis carolinensis TaxID=28377 RepID=G1KJM6_ANOCA
MARNCSGCKEKRPAHSLCTSCNKWLCSLCTEEHRHNKEPEEHFSPIPLKGCSGADGETSEFPLFCPMHSQEALKLFCETCDVLTCRCCLLIEHKEHRFRHLHEALQNQRAILENVTAKVEEKKNGVQVSAKQIEDRLFEVKHLQRKVENQIKMAKMVLISEINKRANVLLEQLERISSERKQKLEQQLQGVMILNRQFEHVQNFLSWAVCSKNNVPFLFSKELIVFQIQRLVETNSNADMGPPWKVRFTWDPSFWTKQLSNLGHLSMEGEPNHHSEGSAYGSVQGISPYLYHHNQGQHSPAPHQNSLNNQSHQFHPPVHCPTPMCCSHCLNIPHLSKGQLPHQTMSNPQSFRQPPEMQHHQQQHFPLQYNLQQADREQRCTLRPLKTLQPCTEQKFHHEHDSELVRMGKHPQDQPVPHAGHNLYNFPSRDDQQGRASHAPQLTAPSAVHNPMVQVQLGPLQKPKMNQSQQQQLQQQEPLLPPQELSPQQSSPSGPNGKARDQVIQQNLDIMHHQFELEEMKKDLELLLQAQQPSLQLNQAKQPQHVQQTIVGQINYIVRQPTAVQQQSQEEAKVSEDSVEPEASSPALPFDRNIIPFKSQPLEETIVSIHSPESTLNSARKQPASLNIVGFPNAVDMDLSSARVSKSSGPQAKEISSITSCQSQNMPVTSDVPPKIVPNYSLDLDRNKNDLVTNNIDHIATGGMPLLSTVCKVRTLYISMSFFFNCKLESEDFGSASFSLGSNSVTPPESKDMLALPIHNILEEPINLSVKKTQPCVSPSIHVSNTDCMQSPNSTPKHSEGTGFLHLRLFKITCAREMKVPYVRLERLKIHTSDSGELPVFKLQPQKNEHDGTFLLIIECGTQSSSMAIKVNSACLVGLRILASQPEQMSLPSVAHRLSNNVKKSVLSEEDHPIENEDFCAVCLNGGELLCCDYCPKVFHLLCHVPALLSFPVGEWVCTLCSNVEKPEVEYDCENARFSYSNTLMPAREMYGLNDYDQKKCEKLVLSLFCNNLSLPFHEPVSPLARHYYQIIKRPMDLSSIRKKLQKKNKLHYSTPEELVADVRLMFWNCATFNYPDSEVAEAGRCLEIFFESKLKEIYPEKQFSLVQQDDSDSDDVEPDTNQVAAKGFQWPSYRPECIQPKRRRRHAESEKTKRPMFWPAKGLSQV